VSKASKFHKNLAKRASKARETQANIITNDRVEVKGSEMTYTVKISRVGKVMVTHCVQNHTGEICKGNSFGTVCYHSIAAAAKLAKSRGYAVSLCISQEHAERLARMGGGVIEIQSANGQGQLWMVAQLVEEPKLAKWQLSMLAQTEKAIREQEEILENGPWSDLAQDALNRLVATREAQRASLGL